MISNPTNKLLGGFCKVTFIRASKNTCWCLLGCSIGDFGTIFFFQITQFDLSTILIMSLAIMNGIITSIALETFILSRQMRLSEAFKVASGMSLISMVAMELSMNITDIIITGGAILTLSVIPIMLLSGFIAPLPYNYWRLKVLNKGCH